MPDVILPYAKAWAALIVAVLTGVSAVTDLPQWVTVTLAALSVIAVYGVPNTPKPDLPAITDGGFDGASGSQDG